MSDQRYSSTFEEMLQGMPVMVWTALPSGALDFVNAHVLDYFARTFQQMIEWGWVQIVHPEDLGRTGEAWSLALETGQPYRNEFRLKRDRDEEYRLHLALAWPRRDSKGEIVSWIGTCTDIEGLE